MDEFRTGLGEAWATIATIIPQVIAFVLILVIGYVVARAVCKIVDRALEKVGFDRWVERGGVKRVLANSSYDASSLLGKIVFYVLMLFVVQLAFGVFGPNPISELITGVIAYLPMVFAAIVIVVVGSAIAAAVKEIIEAALGGLEYGRALAMTASIAILVVTAFAALDQLRIAPNIVNGLFYALLAVVVGSAVIALGGGGIPVARRYLERWAEKADAESERISEATDGAKERIEARARERAAQAQPDDGDATTGGSRSADDADIDLRDDATRPLDVDGTRRR